MPPTAAARFLAERTFHHSRYSPEELAAGRSQSISVCLPARECASTVGEIVGQLIRLRTQGAIDEVVVVDAGSADGTAAVAERAGATVHQQDDLLSEFGPVVGKGDALWRSLSVLAGELVCFLDADVEDFQAHYATGLLGPLADPGAPELAFVKAFYRRPFSVGGVVLEDGGGRVNHLTARPALALAYPELAGVRQPLAGEVAARRDLLERLPFTTGYGVETAMLIDAWREVGLEAMAQVDLGVHRNAHQPLASLSTMAFEVLRVIALRLQRDGLLAELAPGALLGPEGAPVAVADLIERPSLASLALGRP